MKISTKCLALMITVIHLSACSNRPANQSSKTNGDAADTSTIADPAKKTDIELKSFPPELIDRATIKAWTERVLAETNASLELQLLETKDWAHYVNFEHFVPLTLEGVPEGFRFDYNWDPNLTTEKRRREYFLPSAEVTETGKFLLWWDRCNYYQYTAAECEAFIRTVVRHEGRHYVQWLTLAIEAKEKVQMQAAGVVSGETPRNLNDLEKIPGAKAEFMRKWADGAHYQCREVEVYTAQILTQEFSKDIVAGRLKKLCVYYNGCIASPWQNEFKGHLTNARGIFAAHQHECQQK